MLITFVGFGVNNKLNAQSQGIPSKGVILMLEHKLNTSNPTEAKKLEEFSLSIKEKFSPSNQVTYLSDVSSYAIYFSNAAIPACESYIAEISQKFNFVKVKKMTEDEFAVKYPTEFKRISGAVNNDADIRLPANVALPNDPNLKSNKRKN